MSGSKKLLIGKIQGTHGIKGQLRVIPFAGDASSISQLNEVFVKSPTAALEPFAVVSAKAHGKRVILTLKPFDNINQVLHLVGREIYADRVSLPELPDDEFYWSDLLGLQVATSDGEELGELVDIIETGSNDVYVVKKGALEVLIPALEDVVLSINLAEGRMTVSLPEGLLDL
ncbi:16S rRNA processing protein RimM [Citrifermentans bemidjiense Bem]|uniref:Ribosome maturation factor RimM n=1 Tax=Citrifermentans bemidjiense (strain ATCC BAA-1014 / DSM 16622 / JCM 12645 / Bem) TaxID=404380 RepID=B5EBD0_CITBB|nr:ribosome maturation factor RimM [Citrifermentans bemidjiense]ACH40422.1 16S rRNA processing protein RimM [Citrifermentans bemidjiense Bem]